MNNSFIATIVGASLLLVTSTYVFAKEAGGQTKTPKSAESLNQAFSGGKLHLNMRYRYETVDQQSFAEDAKASTIRTRLGYSTAKYKGFSAFVEMDDVSKIGAADYNTPGAGPLSTPQGPKMPGFPIVADPLDTALNQLYLAYADEQNSLKMGRQRIIRGNSRFVGNVGWRQHEQTFDAISYQNKSIENVELYAAYIFDRQTITFTEIGQETLLLDLNYSGLPYGKFTAYYYDIDVEDSRAEWQNYGLRFAGKAGSDDKFNYQVEYAKQENGSGAKPDYKYIELGYKFDPLSISAGLELLGSDRGNGFATPLATLHKFNGWADQFLATPGVGLEDLYVKLATKFSNINLTAVFHQFDSDRNSLDYGDELDLSATRKFGKRYVLGAKFADYSAGDVATNKVDVQKIWLWAQASF